MKLFNNHLRGLTSVGQCIVIYFYRKPTRCTKS